MKYYSIDQEVEIKTNKLRGKILGISSYSNSEIFYRVSTTKGTIVVVNEQILRKCIKYDGNDLSNFANLRHIWRPKGETC